MVGADSGDRISGSVGAASAGVDVARSTAQRASLMGALGTEPVRPVPFPAYVARHLFMSSPPLLECIMA